jgi:hypothetical protein
MHVSPVVWRRILIPSNYTFWELHCAIQDAFGWTGGHSHGFSIAQKGTARPLSIEMPNLDFSDDALDTRNEESEKITDHLGKAVKQCIYTYDFGDNWDHTVLLEKVIPGSEGEVYPKCIAGKNACPPEDCGGVWGYQNLKKVLRDPKHEEYADMLDWLCIENGSEFDPSEFNLSDISFSDPNEVLDEMKR